MCYGPLCIKVPRGVGGMGLLRSKKANAGFLLVGHFNETPQVTNAER